LIDKQRESIAGILEINHAEPVVGMLLLEMTFSIGTSVQFL